MKEEIISREIKLRYTPGNLNPIDINEQYLLDSGIIDEENKLNRGLLRIGSLGTTVIFSNQSQDEIRIQPSSIRIESKSLERVNIITQKIRDSYGGISLQVGGYMVDYHLIDETYPQEIFKRFYSNELELEAIQFKQGNIGLVMYSCGINKIHIKLTNEFHLGKPMSDFNLAEDLELAKLEDVYNSFKTNYLKI